MTAGEVSDDQVMLQYNMLSVCEEADHTEMILSCSDMNDDFIYYKLQYLSKHALCTVTSCSSANHDSFLCLLTPAEVMSSFLIRFYFSPVSVCLLVRQQD